MFRLKSLLAPLTLIATILASPMGGLAQDPSLPPGNTKLKTARAAGPSSDHRPVIFVHGVGSDDLNLWFVAVEYFFKAPSDLAERLVIVVSPVLATGNTAVAAIDRVKERGARDIRFVCLLASPEGVERLRGIHPDVRMWTAAIDDRLDEHAYIIPGLGDAGDRAYGTR